MVGGWRAAHPVPCTACFSPEERPLVLLLGLPVSSRRCYPKGTCILKGPPRPPCVNDSRCRWPVLLKEF